MVRILVADYVIPPDAIKRQIEEMVSREYTSRVFRIDYATHATCLKEAHLTNPERVIIMMLLDSEMAPCKALALLHNDPVSVRMWITSLYHTELAKWAGNKCEDEYAAIDSAVQNYSYRSEIPN